MAPDKIAAADADEVEEQRVRREAREEDLVSELKAAREALERLAEGVTTSLGRLVEIQEIVVSVPLL